MKFTPAKCPVCNHVPHAIVERIVGLAFIHGDDDDDFDYDGETEVCWDTQESITSPDGRVRLVCGHGGCRNEWQARIVGAVEHDGDEVGPCAFCGRTCAAGGRPPALCKACVPLAVSCSEGERRVERLDERGETVSWGLFNERGDGSCEVQRDDERGLWADDNEAAAHVVGLMRGASAPEAIEHAELRRRAREKLIFADGAIDADDVDTMDGDDISIVNDGESAWVALWIYVPRAQLSAPRRTTTFSSSSLAPTTTPDTVEAGHLDSKKGNEDE